MLDHLEHLAFVFRVFRKAKGLTQDELSRRCGAPTNRTAIALLEQGRRPPSPETFAAIAKELGIPQEIWESFGRPESAQRQAFEAALGELAGRTVTLKMMHLESVRAAEQGIRELFSGNLTPEQAYDALNSVLVYYGISRMSAGFFDRYFSAREGAFQSVEAFLKAVQRFQEEAIRLFATFGEAYRRMNETDNIDAILRPLLPRTKEEISRRYGMRTVWEHPEEPARDRIRRIEDSRLPFLGYISVENYKKQRAKREVLANYLRELAEQVRKKGPTAVEDLGEKRRRKLDSLLKELDSTLQHTPISPLFVPNPTELEAEAARILRNEADEQEMARTQSEALTNLSNYISADHMDVYVATSMRNNADYVSVNTFATSLFRHPDIAPLRLRYFNPTQSWIEDRVAKGLVEALMLRRAECTIYMAQKGDTFGKDSEASVALGQGKPVIVYVPKLVFPERELDSESLRRLSDARLKQVIATKGSEDERDIDDTLGYDALYAQALTIELRSYSGNELALIAKRHWADFGLPDEADRIRAKDGKEETRRRDEYSQWMAAVIASDAPPEPADSVRADLLQILVAVTVNFEKRAHLFKAIHPLALQVILSSGVLNGILVCRSVESCAELLRGVIENNLRLKLDVDPDNYRLVETTTGSTIRVISRNNLLTNAFDALYTRTGLETGGPTQR